MDIQAIQLIDENDFGNLIFRSHDGSYWRILPENPACIKIADDDVGFQKVMLNKNFQLEWNMETLVTLARQTIGKLEKGRKYCLKIPAFLGGEYNEGNLGSVSQIEQIEFSGDIARQIDTLPDGAGIELKIN